MNQKCEKIIKNKIKICNISKAASFLILLNNILINTDKGINKIKNELNKYSGVIIGIVNKADYTFKWKRLFIMPQVKLQYQRWNVKTDENPLVDNLLFIPILRFNYPLSKRTTIQCGIQGFPLLENRYWDRVDNKNNYLSRNFMIFVSNVTPFQGYKICTQVGWQYRSINFDDPYHHDSDYYLFYVRAFAGIE